MLRPNSSSNLDVSHRRAALLALRVCLCLFPLTGLDGLVLAQGQSTSGPSVTSPQSPQRKTNGLVNFPQEQSPKTDSAQDGKRAKDGRSAARNTTHASPGIEGLYNCSFRVFAPSFLDAGLEVSLESGRVPLTPDESRSAAKRRWSEAENLRATGTAQSLRNAMSKYEDALRLLRSAGRQAEPGEIAPTLNQLASIADALGDRQQAINYYHQSLPLWRAANDRQNEAATLTQLGRAHNSLGDKQQAQQFFDQA